jgi:hypothetical protein
MTGIVIPDGGTIGSASDTDAISIASDGQVTLPSTSEFPTFIKVFDAGSASASIDSGATNDTTGVNFGSSMSFTFPASSTAIIQSIGGLVLGHSSTLYLSHIGHAYKSGSDFSSSTDGSFFWSGFCRQDGAYTNVPGSASTILTNTGSEATYYIRLAVRTHNSGFNARWMSTDLSGAGSERNRINTTITVYKT